MNTNRIRGILFDKDGTLLDFDATWPPAYQAAAEMLAGLAGNPALVNRVMRLGGYGEDGVLDPVSVFACGSTDEISEFCAAIPELDGIQDIAGRVDRLFTEFGEQAPWVVDCLDAILEGLHGRGFALGLATNDSAASAEAWIAHNDFDRLFDFVAGADSGYGAKPDPAVFHAFCARTGLAAHQICMVGDTIADAELARAGGAGLSVFVETGVAAGADLAALVDHVLPSVADLDRILG
ncbi:MAG: HAD family hydrolase [Pseudomonadota bacterium]|nr:HAD family hydrolase [Pseudomonadota bacterium]